MLFRSNILDFRGQQDAVDAAIALFSGEKADTARQVWLVEPAESINKKYKKAISDLRNFMSIHDLEFKASEVANLRGDEAKAGFINYFKEVQRYKTQLSQYTDFVSVDDVNSQIVSEPQVGYGFLFFVNNIIIYFFILKFSYDKRMKIEIIF